MTASRNVYKGSRNIPRHRLGVGLCHGASSIKDETARAASMLFEAFGASPRVANDDINDDVDDTTHDIDAIVAP